MIGTITILYAVLLALFSHVISPDITPYANDQMNELAFQSPGFSIKVLKQPLELTPPKTCLLYTSDAADERSSVDLGGRRIIKKKMPTTRRHNRIRETTPSS